MSSYSKGFRYIVLYRVCSDLNGPIELQGKNRKHYFMIFFDEYSYCLKVEENLKFLIEYIEVETGQLLWQLLITKTNDHTSGKSLSGILSEEFTRELNKESLLN